MKTGKTLTQLATEIERRANAKADYVASTTNLEMVAGPQEVDLVVGGDKAFAVNGIAHDQIGIHTEIPAKYYEIGRAHV